MKQIVAILGRPNVGKSTLFNILSQGEKAIVHSEAGVTRDIRKVQGTLFDLNFTLMDTAGIEADAHKMQDGGMAADLNRVALKAADMADVFLLVIDGAAGVLPNDEALAQQLRSMGKPVILVMNKADTAASHDTQYEALALGLGEPVSISAAHHRGLEDLQNALSAFITAEEEPETPENTFFEEEIEEPEGPMPMAIVGRPNVGKSTFVNQILGEERMLAGDIAGLTRESIGTPFTHKDRELLIVDTPGLRKKAKVTEQLENMSTSDAIKAVKASQAVLLILDASHFSVENGTTDVFEQQDARIADVAVSEGKPLVIALNKWDLVEDKETCLEDVRYQLNQRFSQVQDIPLVPMSATRGKGVSKAIDALLEVNAKSMTKVPTSLLNRFLDVAIAQKSPPLAKGKSVKLKFISQTGVNPPTFRIFGNRVNHVPAHYQRYLMNQLREAFDLAGVPLRIYFKSGDNPFK